MMKVFRLLNQDYKDIATKQILIKSGPFRGILKNRIKREKQHYI